MTRDPDDAGLTSLYGVDARPDAGFMPSLAEVVAESSADPDVTVVTLPYLPAAPPAPPKHDKPDDATEDNQ